MALLTTFMIDAMTLTAPFRRDVADSPSGSIEEEVEVFRIVGVHERRFERRKVGEENPIPRCNQHVFSFYITVTNL